MSLADDIAAERGLGRTPLRVDVVLAGLSDEDAKDLRDALADPSVPERVISRAVEKRGISLSAGAVGTWRLRHR